MNEPSFVAYISYDGGRNIDLEEVAGALEVIFDSHDGRLYPTFVWNDEYLEQGIVFSTDPVTREEAHAYFAHVIKETYGDEK